MTATPSPLRAAPETFARREWPRAAWYAAAYDVEVGAHLLPRTVAGPSLSTARSSATALSRTPTLVTLSIGQELYPTIWESP